MMSKVLSYKLALLGCVSSCLMNVAYANEVGNQANDDRIIIIGDHHREFRDVVCNAEPRFVSFWLKNIGDDNFEVTKLDINPNHDDDFSSYDIVSLPAPGMDNKYACGHEVPGRVPFKLKPGESCELLIEVNPEDTQACLDVNGYPPIGHISRELLVTYDGPLREVRKDIEFDFTYLGSGDDFSIIGNNIHNDQHKLATAQSGVIQVSQDVGITKKKGHLTDDISYSDESRPFRYGTVTMVAFEDLTAAFDNMLNITTTCQTTNGLPNTLDDSASITNTLTMRKQPLFV